MLFRNNKILSLFLLFVAAWLAACTTSPTGRRQLQLIPEQQMTEMGHAAFQQLKQDTPIETSTQVQRYVECVANELIAALPGNQDWEVEVFKDDSVNAFALPGGKIGVHTGLLGVAENQHQLAAVIGHEIAHVQANHPNARVSAAYATNAGLQLTQVLLSGDDGSGQKQTLMGLLGLGAQVGVLMPYGRSQESEADTLGIEIMAEAGFDPQESIALWRNMAQSSGDQPPEFLSTHPSPDSRIKKLSRHMDTAMAKYRQAQAAGKKPNCRRG